MDCHQRLVAIYQSPSWVLITGERRGEGGGTGAEGTTEAGLKRSLGATPGAHFDARVCLSHRCPRKVAVSINATATGRGREGIRFGLLLTFSFFFFLLVRCVVVSYMPCRHSICVRTLGGSVKLTLPPPPPPPPSFFLRQMDASYVQRARLLTLARFGTLDLFLSVPPSPPTTHTLIGYEGWCVPVATIFVTFISSSR